MGKLRYQDDEEKNGNNADKPMKRLDTLVHGGVWTGLHDTVLIYWNGGQWLRWEKIEPAGTNDGLPDPLAQIRVEIAAELSPHEECQ